MKRLLIGLCAVLMLSGCGSKESSVAKIGVIQLVEHTSLNEIYDSFSKELVALGYEDGKNVVVDFKNCQGELSNLPSIVQNFEADKKDVVVAITTPVAQGAMALAKNTPVVFSAVTDPVAAKIVTDLSVTDKNITGTSDAVSVEQIIELAMTLVPSAKKVGFIYNPSEANSVSNYEKLLVVAKDKQLEVEAVSIASSTELQTAASVLCTKVDMIFVSNDNTVAEGMPILAKVANEAKIPVFTGADSMVKDGGLATVGIDYSELGKKTAQMVVEILKGKKVSELPVVVFKDNLFITINETTAAAIGLAIPEEVLKNPKCILVK